MTGPGSRRTIRLFPDYGRDWPLWENTTETHDYGYTMKPGDYGLSAELTEALASWNRLWERHFNYEHGWDSPASRESWASAGQTVAHRLAAEVSAFADVSYEPWPLDFGRP